MDIPLGGGRWIGGFGVLRNILVLYNQRELGIRYIAQSRLLVRSSVPWRKMAQSGVDDFKNVVFSFRAGMLVLYVQKLLYRRHYCAVWFIKDLQYDRCATYNMWFLNIFDRELLVGVSRKTASKHWKAVNSVLSPQCPLLSRRIFVHNVLHFLSYNNNNLDYNMCMRKRGSKQTPRPLRNTAVRPASPGPRIYLSSWSQAGTYPP